MASVARGVNPLGLGSRCGYDAIMSKADQHRDEKLAAALRENLRRRKAQARGAGPEGQTSDENQAASE
jgi:hypothetical protein